MKVKTRQIMEKVVGYNLELEEERMKVKTRQIMEKVVGYNLELEELLASRASIEHKEETWKQCYEIAVITSQAGRMFAKLLSGFHEELTKNHGTAKTQD